MKFETTTRFKPFKKKALIDDVTIANEDGTPIDPEQISEMANEFVTNSTKSAKDFVSHAAGSASYFADRTAQLTKEVVKYSSVAIGVTVGALIVLNAASEIAVKKTHAN